MTLLCLRGTSVSTRSREPRNLTGRGRSVLARQMLENAAIMRNLVVVLALASPACTRSTAGHVVMPTQPRSGPTRSAAVPEDLVDVARRLAGTWTCKGQIDLARPRELSPPTSPGRSEMADVGFELTYDVRGLELLVESDEWELDPNPERTDASEIDPDPVRGVRRRNPGGAVYAVKTTTRFTQTPAAIRDNLRGELSTWWIYDPTSRKLRRDGLDEMVRFSTAYPRISRTQITWHIRSGHLGQMVDRVELVSPTEIKLTGEYATDDRTWTLDHEARCTK